MSDPRWPRRIGHPAAPCNLTPAWAGQFSTFTDWLDKALTWIDAHAVCIDAKGRRCVQGSDFMRARDEDAFPVRFFWECEDPDTTPLLPWERRWWAAHDSRKGTRPPTEDRQRLAGHLFEEAGEVDELVVRSGGALSAQGIEGELADCYMLIRALFRHYGLDPDVEAERKLNEVLARPEWAPYSPGHD